MAWTDDRTAILKKLWTDGASASAIATKLGEVTRNAVIGKVHRLGLAGHKTGARKAAAPIAGFPFTTRSRRRSRSRPSRTHSSTPALRPRTVRPPMRSLSELSPAPEVPVTIATLTDRLCHWPQGDPKLEGFHFCGRTRTRSAIPYCDHHAAIAYN
jgi:GcrA cell cycle regulator